MVTVWGEHLITTGLNAYPGLVVDAHLSGTGSRVGNLTWAPDGTRIAVGYSDSIVRIFDPVSGQQTWETRTGEGAVWHVVWSPGGDLLATYSVDGAIRLWEPPCKAPETEIPIPDGSVLALAWSEDESALHIAVEIENDSRHRIVFFAYDWKSGRILRELTAEEGCVGCAAVSGDRRFLALASIRGPVKIWDLQTFDQIATFPGQEPVCTVARSPAAPLLALGLLSGTIQVRSLPEGQLVRSLEAHHQITHSVDFSSDGTMLASKSQDGTVCLWRCDTWALVLPLAEPSVTRSEIEVHFHPRALELATFDQRNTVVRIWKIDQKTLFAVGGGSVIRILYLGADPPDPSLVQLRLDEEIREIQDELQRSDLRERFTFHVKPAVRPEDLSRALLSLRPQVVHFSGHGEEQGEIWLEDRIGGRHPIGPDDLAALFQIVQGTVSCVVLNACYSEKQAKALARHVPYIVGMTRKVKDCVAIAFSIGFYQGLGAGLSFPKAFEAGCALIRMKVGSDWTTPVLVSG
jgi:WD40 repeat protein